MPILKTVPTILIILILLFCLIIVYCILCCDQKSEDIANTAIPAQDISGTSSSSSQPPIQTISSRVSNDLNPGENREPQEPPPTPNPEQDPPSYEEVMRNEALYHYPPANR